MNAETREEIAKEITEQLRQKVKEIVQETLAASSKETAKSASGERDISGAAIQEIEKSIWKNPTQAWSGSFPLSLSDANPEVEDDSQLNENKAEEIEVEREDDQKKKTRFTLDLAPDEYEALEELAQKSNIPKSQAARKAIALLSLVSRIVDEGYEIGVIKNGEVVKEIVGF